MLLVKYIASRPLIVLAISLVATLVLALLVILVFTGDRRIFLLYYFVPICAPFVAYLFDRLERWPTFSRDYWLIEGPIMVLALLRAFVGIPLISGHSLFLSYAMLSTKSWVLRLASLLVMLEVAYFKILVWADLTIIGGILLGMGAALTLRLTSPVVKRATSKNEID